MNTTQLRELARRTIDLIEATEHDYNLTAGGVQTKQMADGSGRWMSLLPLVHRLTGHEHTFRVVGPAPRNAPTWIHGATWRIDLLVIGSESSSMAENLDTAARLVDGRTYTPGTRVFTREDDPHETGREGTYVGCRPAHATAYVLFDGHASVTEMPFDEIRHLYR